MEVEELAKQPLKTDRELKRVEIIILGFKNPAVEALCLERLIHNTLHPYKLTFYDNKENPPNFSKIWNKLVQESTCDYILIMDSDVYVERFWLEAMMKNFDNPEVGVVGPNFEYKEFDGTISGCCFLFKKEVFEKVGQFDERFYLFGQECEWQKRVLTIRGSGLPAYKIVIEKEAIVEHRNKEGTIQKFYSPDFIEKDTCYARKLLGIPR